MQNAKSKKRKRKRKALGQRKLIVICRNVVTVCKHARKSGSFSTALTIINTEIQYWYVVLVLSTSHKKKAPTNRKGWVFVRYKQARKNIRGCVSPNLRAQWPLVRLQEQQTNPPGSAMGVNKSHTPYQRQTGVGRQRPKKRKINPSPPRNWPYITVNKCENVLPCFLGSYTAHTVKI